MSRWNHSICEECWNKRHPDREPVRIREEYRDEKPIPCCYCSRPHQSGIYVRDDPATLSCRGIHPSESEGAQA